MAVNAPRTLADGLVAIAGQLPRQSETGRLLRDAAASLLDADAAAEREGLKILLPLSDKTV